MDKKLYKHGRCSWSGQDKAERPGMPDTPKKGLITP